MAEKTNAEFADLLREDRAFPPPASFRAHAHVRDEQIYKDAARDPEGFWAKFADELEWSRRWDKVLDWQPPHAKWFVGGTINASVNCLDRHVRGPRRDKAALIWEGEPGDRRTLTYFDLYRQVSAFANVLKSLGVRKGDRVAIYLPLVPELAVAMLACARIGAIHSVVFGGFSAESLRDRINDSACRLLITADGEIIENPRHYRTAERRLQKAQRRVSRRKTGSKRRAKAVHLLKRKHQKVRRQRQDFHHKTALYLLSTYDTLYLEDLRVANMVRNPHLAKSISDAGWAAFRTILEAKAACAGRRHRDWRPARQTGGR